MKTNPLAKALVVFVAVFAVLIVLFSQFGFLYFKLFQGIFRWEIDSFFPPFKVTTLELENYGGQEMIALKARLTENIVLKDGSVLHTTGRPYSARTIAINHYLHPIIIFSILFAWPGLIWQDRFKVFLLALPCLLMVEMVDIPLLLGTRCMELMRAKLLQDPSAEKSLGSYWVAFLHTGGREALSILAVGLALGCFHLHRVRQKLAANGGPRPPLQPQRTKAGRNAPCPCGSGKKYKNCCGSK